ncbi:6641_t:CDS:2, partial [Gigaspora rosea]
MASRNSETASNTFSVSKNEPQEYSKTNETSESSQSLTKRKNVSGKKQGDIWLYVNQGISLGRGHYKASCKYCPVSWNRVEDMAKIHSYYLSNSDKELQLYGKNLNNEELYESINTSIVTYDLLKTLDDNTNNGKTNESEYLENLTLNIANSVDLTLTEFLASGDAIFFSEPVTTNRARDVGNMNYNPIELAQHQMGSQQEVVNGSGLSFIDLFNTKWTRCWVQVNWVENVLVILDFLDGGE